MPKLTDMYVDNVPLDRKRTMHWDTLIPAFGMRVGARRKTFITIDGNGRRTVLGHYPAMSLSQARQKARDLMSGLQTRHGAFCEVWEEYKRQYLVNYRPRSAYNVEKLVEKYCKPVMDLPIAELTPRHITALYPPSKTQSNHLFGMLRTFLAWAERHEYIDRNPTAKLTKPFKERSRSHVLSDEDIKRIWNACSDLTPFTATVRLLILTAARRSEIPGPKTFTDSTVTFLETKNGKPHTLPTTPLMRELFLVASMNNSWSKNKTALDRISGVTDWTLHDLRRSWATRAASLGIRPETIERVLNHSTTHSAIHSVYNRHAYMDEMREALLKVEANILTLVTLAP